MPNRHSNLVCKVFWDNKSCPFNSTHDIVQEINNIRMKIDDAIGKKVNKSICLYSGPGGLSVNQRTLLNDAGINVTDVVPNLKTGSLGKRIIADIGLFAVDLAYDDKQGIIALISENTDYGYILSKLKDKDIIHTTILFSNKLKPTNNLCADHIINYNKQKQSTGLNSQNFNSDFYASEKKNENVFKEIKTNSDKIEKNEYPKSKFCEKDENNCNSDFKQTYESTIDQLNNQNLNSNNDSPDSNNSDIGKSLEKETLIMSESESESSNVSKHSNNKNNQNPDSKIESNKQNHSIFGRHPYHSRFNPHQDNPYKYDENIKSKQNDKQDSFNTPNLLNRKNNNVKYNSEPRYKHKDNSNYNDCIQNFSEYQLFPNKKKIPHDYNNPSGYGFQNIPQDKNPFLFNTPKRVPKKELESNDDKEDSEANSLDENICIFKGQTTVSITKQTNSEFYNKRKSYTSNKKFGGKYRHKGRNFSSQSERNKPFNKKDFKKPYVSGEDKRIEKEFEAEMNN